MSALPTITETLAAVDVLSRTGISDELIGRTVREWLARTRTAGSPSLGEPAVHGAIMTPPQPVRPPSPPAALGTWLSGTVAATNPPMDLSDSSLKQGELVWLKVRMPDKAATNVVVPERLLAAVALKFGGDQEARRMARELAKVAPIESKKRSKWVVDRLLEKLASQG